MSILLVGSNGYIGSAVYKHLRGVAFEVDCVDDCRRGNPAKIPHACVDYADLTANDIADYEDIVLLAGHANVPSAIIDPSGAFDNNVVSFQRLLERLGSKQRLIYASSSSVYSGFGATAATEDMPETGNMYDLGKSTIDALAAISGKRCYGLRFGTVNGPSANIRNDVMLNKMVYVALLSGHVAIQNPQIHRPILGIKDLSCAVTDIMDGNGEPGVYNLASFNATVSELGQAVADKLNVPLVINDATVAYDFEISSQKFKDAYDFEFYETAISIVNDLVSVLDDRDDSGSRQVRADDEVSGVRRRGLRNLFGPRFAATR